VTAAPEPYASPSASAADAAPDWDAVAKVWRGAPPQTLWRRHSDDVNSALLRRWLPPHCDTILKTDLWDEAMGAGLYPVLAERATRLVGIDVSEPVVAAAKQRYPAIEAFVAGVKNLPLQDGSVDAVVSNSTLDHFEAKAEIDASIRELARVIRPGGKLVLTLDNPHNPLVALSKVVPPRQLNRMWLRLGSLSASAGLIPYHVGVTYARRPLLRVLAEAGFRVEAQTTLVHSPRILAVLAGRFVEGRAGASTQERFLRLLGSAERLGSLPTRFVTGHFYAVRATRL
jgi:SAM-dependent methyltransferase